MTDRILSRSALALCAAAVLCAPAAHADDDRFTLRLSGMHAKAETQFKADAIVGGDAYEYESERWEIGEKTVPRIEGMFRAGDRHRLLFNYFRYSEGNSATLGQDLDFGGIGFPADSQARLDTDFHLASLVYDYAVVETPTASIGLQIGLESARLEADLRATAGDDSFRAHGRETGHAPVVGLRAATNTSDGRWRFVAQAQYLDADWGDFDDYKGDISRANALVEYRFTDRVGVHVGYDWFKLDIRKSGSEGTVGLDQRFRGPVAGVTLAF